MGQTKTSKYYFVVDNQSIKAKKIRKQLLKLLPANWIYNQTWAQYVFVIGGDGTFLRNKYLYNTKYIIAINGGNLGYYAHFNTQNLTTLLTKISDKKSYFNPLIIEIKTPKKNYFAINEFLIRSDKVLQTNVYINSFLLQNFKGTGLLISTPLGSTAHAKNAGGAILVPNLALFQLLEIEPLTQKNYHSLKSPLVLDCERIIILKAKKNNHANIIADGIKLPEQFEFYLKIQAKHAPFFLFKPNYNQNYLKKIRNSFIKD